MESGIMRILQIGTSRMKELSALVGNLLNKYKSDSQLQESILQQIEINSSKLENSVNKVKTDMNAYFRFVNEPDADEISQIATNQLEAEELLCETRIILKGKGTSGERLTTGKLPKLNLPEFEGDILHWTQFWDQFSSNIHNRNIADVEKLLYLKASLKGQAKQLVEGYESTNANYKIAISSLIEKYGKPTKVIDAHYSALNKIIPAEKSVNEYRRVLNDIERHLRVLNSLGEDTSHSYLRFLILEKFPEELIYEMKMKLKDESIEEIRKELDKIITAKEEASHATWKESNNSEKYTTETLHTMDKTRENNIKIRNTEQRNQPQKRKYEDNRQEMRERNYKDSTRPVVKRSKLECVFCSGNHFNDNCLKFKSLDERRSRLTNRCLSCFKLGHYSRDCRNKRTCYYCKNQHNRALCPRRFKGEESSKKENSTKEEEESKRVESSTTYHVNCDRGSTILQTAIVEAQKSKEIKGVKCRVLLDSGSQRSYITQKLAKELNLKVKEENKLVIFTFGSKTPQEVDSPVVQLYMKSKTGNTISIDANIIPMISHSVPYPELDLIERHRPSLADDGSLQDQVDILIGNDYYFTLMSTDKIKIKENLYLIDSNLGWILSGKGYSKDEEKLAIVTYFQTNLEVKFNHPDLPLTDGNLKELWSLESIGINDSPKESREEEAIGQFNETTKLIDNRYYVTWPWIEYPPPLTTNFGLAFGRLVNLIKRLDLETRTSYDQLIKEQKEKGIIEIVPDLKENIPRHPVHYLPHHGVKQAGKSMRIVYDASSKTKDNKSLNECLYRGPLMLEDLTGLILKFRCHPIGISADVEKAFLQIGLHETDRDVTRFLWLKDVYKPATEDNLLHLRFCRVPFGVISSPFLLNATIRYHLKNSDKEEIQNLANDIYVDNVITGTNSVQAAERLYKEAKEVFEVISMNLRDWSSNSDKLMEGIPDSCKDKTVKVLGLDWNTKEDSLRLRFKNTDGQAQSKREVLKIIASVFDPCGFAAPLLLAAKLLLQELWTTRLQWDTRFAEETRKKWEMVYNDLNKIKDIKLPRYYFKNCQKEEYSLHCFADASTKAYAAVVYITNSKEKSFVIGKSRLVPVKNKDTLSIPRLELLGMLIGSRLIKYVLNFLPLKVTRQILWTDSQIAIDWCKSDKLLPPFIARRVEEIKKNKDLVIRHVPSELNPADVATRPEITIEEKEIWLSGPQFLLEDTNSWPSNAPIIITCLAVEGHSNEDTEIESHLDGVMDRTIHPSKEQHKEKPVPRAEDHQSESMITGTSQELKMLQAEYFPQEVDGKVTSLSRNLGLFKDIDGILRSKGRLQNADFSFDKRYPIIIPKDCDFTNKLIMRTHEDNYHVGVNHTLSLIRQTYWIPQGKSQVQKLLRKCPNCVKHGGGPFKLPPTPALPAERVNYSSPFTYVGVDYMGPLLVNNGNGNCKRWICLYTCLVVRAVHLEIVQDLTAEEGLLALRRFISTRGVPLLITSDNAQHFKLMAEILASQYCITKKIQWRFIPQRAPWFGGYYERLIGIVKNCMKRTLQKHLLRDNQLNTVIKEIEATFNTRPLTCVDSEPEHILRPSDFLTMGKCIATETSEGETLLQGTTTKTDLVKAWKRALIILDEFKEMFLNRYLPSLRERYWHSLKEPRVTSRMTPRVGQIVQIKGDSRNREEWKVGKIISLPKGADDLCRTAKVRAGEKEYIRSLAHLYPLEISEDSSEDVLGETLKDTVNEEVHRTDMPVTEAVPVETQLDEDISVETSNESEIMSTNTTEEVMTIEESEVNDDTKDKENVDKRPRRIASTRALEKIRQWTNNLLALL